LKREMLGRKDLKLHCLRDIIKTEEEKSHLNERPSLERITPQVEKSLAEGKHFFGRQGGKARSKQKKKSGNWGRQRRKT